MPEYEVIIGRVRDVQKRWGRTRLWTLLWTGLLRLTGLLLGVSLIDLVFPLPFAVRLTLWAIAAGAIVTGIVFLYVRRGNRRLGDQEAALLVERHYPHLKDHLVSSVQLGASRKVGRAVDDDENPITCDWPGTGA